MESRGYEIDTTGKFVLNGQEISFYILERVTRRKSQLTAAEKEKSWMHDKWIYTPNGELMFTIDEVWIDRKNWRDKKNRPVEDQLNDVSGIITAAEMIRLKKLEREAELERSRQEERRRRELELHQQIERKLRSELQLRCNEWTLSRQVKRFFRECEKFLANSRDGMRPDNEEAEWLKWAWRCAEELDPEGVNGAFEQALVHHRTVRSPESNR